MAVNLQIADHFLTTCWLISLSVDEISLRRYIYWSTNFRRLLFNKEVASSHLKHMNSVLFRYKFETNAYFLLASAYAADIFLELFITKLSSTMKRKVWICIFPKHIYTSHLYLCNCFSLKKCCSPVGWCGTIHRLHLAEEYDLPN